MRHLVFLLAFTLLPVSASADWRTDLEVAYAAGLDAHPELFAAVATAQPARTRAGTLRFFNDPDVLDPAAVPAILTRLVAGGDSADVRRALAERLHRVDALWDDARLRILVSDGSEEVRAMMAAGLRWTGATAARSALEVALADASPRVRAEAAVTISRRPDAVEMLPLLLPALSDPAPGVRLRALHAVDAIAPNVAIASSVVQAMVSDPDPGVARAAARVLE
jgi:HEAT repeat protein